MTNHVPEATKPASGDYAWLGAEAGSVADLMYMLNTEDWYDAINSRFVSELLDDTLPESILKAYLIQDFKFYNNGMMARLIKLAPRQETKDMLAAQSQWFADNEATYFEPRRETLSKSAIRSVLWRKARRNTTRPNRPRPTRSTAHTLTACPTRAGRN